MKINKQGCSQAAILILMFYAIAAIASFVFGLKPSNISFSLPFRSKRDGYINKTDERHEKIQKILITTVGRSGSSAFGQILGQMSPKSYYVFEPLHRYSVQATSQKGTLQEVFRILSSYLTCEVADDLRERVYNHRFARITRRDSRLKPTDPKAPEEDQFKELCPQSDLRIIKSIRLTFLPLEDQRVIYRELLDLFPDLAIVILYRDPRKVYLSSVDRKFGVSGIQETCSEQLSLHLTLGQYSSNYADSLFPHAHRIFPIKYENMSADALSFAQNLRNQILGAPLDEEGTDWIEKNIVSRKSKGSKYELSDDFSKQARQVEECIRFSQIANYQL